jgi:hypothetical protein
VPGAARTPARFPTTAAGPPTGLAAVPDDGQVGGEIVQQRAAVPGRLVAEVVHGPGEVVYRNQVRSQPSGQYAHGYREVLGTLLGPKRHRVARAGLIPHGSMLLQLALKVCTELSSSDACALSSGHKISG